MATFYYSTEGDKWTICSAPTNFTDQAAIDQANAACNGVDFAWLTPTSECSWFGLGCNDMGVVNSIDIGKFICGATFRIVRSTGTNELLQNGMQWRAHSPLS